MNPWVPNQHGAWPMVTIPPLVGLFWCLKIWDAVSPADRGEGMHGTAGMVLTFLAVTVAWVVGYLAFFAGGILMRARNATMRGRAVAPTLLYGAVAGLAAVLALILQPHLLWWAFVFLPLIAIAVYETWRGTPRSLASGVATTAASVFIVPVAATIGLGASNPVSGGVTWTSNLFTPKVVEALPSAVWVSFLWLLLYTVGTIFYVKTMIRKKGDPGWLAASQIFHLAALIIVVVYAGFAMGDLVMFQQMGFGVGVALLIDATIVRSIVVPSSMALLGRWNWWAPGPLRRVHARFGVSEA